MPGLRGVVGGGEGAAVGSGRDLSACGQQIELWWRKRRLWCRESLCPRRSFTQACEAVKPRGRITERLRDKLASAIAGSNRPVSDVAEVAAGADPDDSTGDR